MKKKLEDATNNTKSWKHKVAEREGLLRLIQPGTNLHVFGVRTSFCVERKDFGLQQVAVKLVWKR